MNNIGSMSILSTMSKFSKVITKRELIHCPQPLPLFALPLFHSSTRMQASERVSSASVRCSSLGLGVLYTTSNGSFLASSFFSLRSMCVMEQGLRYGATHHPDFISGRYSCPAIIGAIGVSLSRATRYQFTVRSPPVVQRNIVPGKTLYPGQLATVILLTPFSHVGQDLGRRRRRGLLGR